MVGIESTIQGIASRLKDRLSEIAVQRNEALKANGVDVSALDPIREDIEQLKQRIESADKDRRYVAEYRDWLAVSWSQRQQHADALSTARTAKQQLEESHRQLMKERDDDLAEHDQTAKQVADGVDKSEKLRREAYGQIGNLASWPKDKAIGRRWKLSISNTTPGTHKAMLCHPPVLYRQLAKWRWFLATIKVSLPIQSI